MTNQKKNALHEAADARNRAREATLGQPGHRAARHLEVHEKLPPGFNRYRGKGNPFGDGALVYLAIRVRPEGSAAKNADEAHVIMIAGPKRAWTKPPEERHPRQGVGVHPAEWDVPASEFGSIAGTMLAPPEPPQ
jgi:hypothetical protein